MTARERTVIHYMIDRQTRARLARAGKAQRRQEEIEHERLIPEGVCKLPLFSVIPQCGRRVPVHYNIDGYEGIGEVR